MPRYIDADKLLMNFNDWALSVSPDERHEGTERLIRQTAYETIQSAIESIIEQPDLQQTCNQLATDCINRQDAINVVAGIDKYFVKYIEQLPSAQPEPIRINLNEPIKVKLTDWGKEIYYHQYDRTNQIAGRKICEPKFPKEDENGYTEFQLWYFIELYGMHMGMTLPNVIKPLEIVYER